MSDRSDYFDAARSWATDTRSREARLRHIAWTIAGVATAVALFEAVALALLTPLKTVQPVTLLVDRQTGYVQALDPLQPRRIGADAALTQSLLAQYVAAREGFDRATVASDYRRVALWSTGLARSQYLGLMPASNPDSPLQRYPGGTTVMARVKSISSLDNGTTLVRFDTQRQERTGATGPVQPWISVVRYHYSAGPMAFEDRLVNPLGFQVTSYRRDAEAPPPEPAAQPAVYAGDRAASSVVRAIPPATTAARVVSAALPSMRADPGRAAIRSVPSNQIPFGSPLVPHPSPSSRPGGGP